MRRETLGIERVSSVMELPAALADTEDDLADARVRLEQINADVRPTEALAALRSDSSALATQISAAEGRFEEAEAELKERKPHGDHSKIGAVQTAM